MLNSNRQFLFILLFAFAALIALQANAYAGVRLALVLGNSKYQAVPELDNPANDAADLAQALRGVGFEVIEQRDATREAMAKAVHDFSDRLRGADVAVFFYAGHGMQMNGENYLLPVDAKIESPADVRFNTINLTDIQQEMEGSGAGRANIIILDACRNNPFIEKLAHGGRAAPTRGLGRVEATGEGSLIVYSTQPNNIALDGMGRNSPFTSALLKHIATPGLEVRQMISKVRGDVLAATEKRQTPWDSSSLVGDVYLAGQPAAQAAPDAAPNSAELAAVPKQAPATPPANNSSLRDAANSSPPQGPTNDCDRLAAPRVPFSSPDAVQDAKPVDWARAVEACQEQIKANPKEMRFENQLGIAYRHLKNYAEAARHFRIAADAGFANALFNLGAAYDHGQGVLQNYPMALALYEKAVEKGSASAMVNLGAMYSDGRGVPKDEVKSLEWDEKAVEAGQPFGLAGIAVHYFNGTGVPRDFNMAAQYLQQEADLGDGYSLRYLAEMYEKGYLGAPDLQKAGALRLRAQQVDPTGVNPPPLSVFRQATQATPSQTIVHRRRYVVYRRYRFMGLGLGCPGAWC